MMTAQAHIHIIENAPTTELIPAPAMRMTGVIEREHSQERRIPAPKKALIQALKYVFSIANDQDRATGNWGVAVVIQVLISAYTEGTAGFLAKHVLEWQRNNGVANAERDTKV